VADPTPPDPFKAWRDARDSAMNEWAKSMSQYVGTESFAKNMGQFLDSYLATAAPYQKAMADYMESTLGRLNMPTRDEVLSISRRLTNVEKRLDDLDARFDELMDALRRIDAQAATLKTIEARLKDLTAQKPAADPAASGAPAKRQRAKDAEA
jgi:polyhydroxyalkanoic acid synthase PhaR subunit